jgi:hypothetical protein
MVNGEQYEIIARHTLGFVLPSEIRPIGPKAREDESHQDESPVIK